jgi:hypothetical protein
LWPFFLRERASSLLRKENDMKVTRRFLLWCSSFF